jgi:phosphatidate cytidylyltransferase
MAAVGIACGIFLMVLAFCDGRTYAGLPSPMEFLLLSMILVVVKALLSHSLEVAKNSIIPTIVGIIYSPFMCCFPIALFREMAANYPSGRAYSCTLIWMVVVAKCCDIGGMFAGKYFGSHKLAPNFSPQKTVEGLIGGVFASNVVGIALWCGNRQLFPSGLDICNTALLATLLAIFSLVGDLTESAIKRLANVKDSGTILPGIGGIFDLTDSLLFSIPIGVMFVKYFAM